MLRLPITSICCRRILFSWKALVINGQLDKVGFHGILSYLLAQPLEHQIALASFRSHQEMVAHLHTVARSLSRSLDIEPTYQSQRQKPQLYQRKISPETSSCTFGERHEVFSHSGSGYLMQPSLVPNCS
jgi:hypothetical protein